MFTKGSSAQLPTAARYAWPVLAAVRKQPNATIQPLFAPECRFLQHKFAECAR
jgi:hypothetical protein